MPGSAVQGVSLTMAIKKTATGWMVDIRPTGAHGKRYRKTFKTKAEGLRWEAWMKHQHTQQPDWQPPKQDNRRLYELIQEWHQLHGKHLKDGGRRKSILENICYAMGNPVAADIKGVDFTTYRASRTDEVTDNTLNHELAYLRAVFNELIRQEHWQRENPLKNVRPLKTDERELTWLSRDEINLLMKHLSERRNTDTIKVAKVCLATGARWSEAEGLTASQVRNNQITYNKTKSGKSRTVPIAETLYREIKTRETGRLFGNCYQSFTNALEESGIELPKGQRTHVLRHTFASHFMMNGGNLLTLQKVLGHASIQMTMRYAHLAPEHLNQVLTCNPVNFEDSGNQP